MDQSSFASGIYFSNSLSEKEQCHLLSPGESWDRIHTGSQLELKTMEFPSQETW